jgi:nucleotidyltransferase/DNA polymerase involved in DNA repair
MDAFFAAIEQREHPRYKNKPVIVGADPRQGKGRGVVSTCSYEARKYGVHSAMPISQAYKLCPHGIYVPPNGHLYSQVSDEIFESLYEFTDQVEPVSIDEAFLDITGCIHLFGTIDNLARELKRRILCSQDLTASVGVAPNKFIAKIASDLKKPDGLVIVEAGQIQEFLDPLSVAYIWGAGKKTIARLNHIGVYTIGDLRQFPADLLRQYFGKLGDHFNSLAHGLDDRPVISGQEVKSVSNEVTFNEDIADAAVLQRTLFQLAEKVAYRLRQKGLYGKTIHLKLRYQGFDTITRVQTIPVLTANTEKIFTVARELFNHNYQQGRKVRLLGIGVSGFTDTIGRQMNIFESGLEKNDRLDVLEDLVKKKFGRKSISRAEGLTHETGQDEQGEE